VCNFKKKKDKKREKKRIVGSWCKC
jgi:hypothetical protein